MQKSRTLLVLIATFTLTACASISEKDCDSAGLYQRGLSDGKNGKGTEQFQDLQRSCSKVGINAAGDSYEYGRKVGIADFCSESRAKGDAKSGTPEAICMKEQVPMYQKAYETAKAERDQATRDKIQDLQKQQDKLQKKEDEAKKKLNQ